MRTASQYGSRSITARRSRCVARSVCASAATRAEAGGWEVVPAIGADATSTASTPASTAASRVASWPPAVSWVCRCTGRSNRSRSADDQLGRRRRPQQPGHVLDRQDVRAGLDDLLGQPQVVVEGVERLVRVVQVGGVAQRHLRDRGAGLADRLDRRPHLLDVVQGVEDPEDVDADLGRLGHEGGGHLGRVRRVADGVATAQQHLQAQPRHVVTQRGQPLPRVLLQEAERDVVRGPAPALDGEQLGVRSGPRTARPAAGPWSAPGWRAGTGARRGRWCR